MSVLGRTRSWPGQLTPCGRSSANRFQHGTPCSSADRRRASALLRAHRGARRSQAPPGPEDDARSLAGLGRTGSPASASMLEPRRLRPCGGSRFATSASGGARSDFGYAARSVSRRHQEWKSQEACHRMLKSARAGGVGMLGSTSSTTQCAADLPRAGASGQAAAPGAHSRMSATRDARPCRRCGGATTSRGRTTAPGACDTSALRRVRLESAVAAAVRRALEHDGGACSRSPGAAESAHAAAARGGARRDVRIHHCRDLGRSTGCAFARLPGSRSAGPSTPRSA